MMTQQLLHITMLKAFLRSAGDPEISVEYTMAELAHALALLPVGLIAALIAYDDEDKPNMWLRSEIKKAGFEL